MKELTIEQKAQKYDEAIERAKALYDNNQPISSSNVIIDNIFPQLKESKESRDERIRKKLLSSFKDIMADADEDELWYELPYTDIIAWLKKQGNLMKALQISNARIGELIEENYYLKEQVEKQSESMEINPTEFDTRLQSLIEKFDSLPNEILVGSLNFWTNVVQNDGTYKDEQESAWSKDDITRINEIIETLNIVQANRVHTQRMHYNRAAIDKDIDWLKSLKNKIQPHQEWSEEDEKRLNDVIELLPDLSNRHNWLKSLKERIQSKSL